MKELTLNDILGIQDRDTTEVPVEEWNGCVYVRMLSATERSEIEEFYMTIKDKKKGVGTFRKEVLKRCLVNKDGTPMITDEAVANHLMGKNANAIETIFEAACTLNGFREKDVDTLKKK